MSNDKEEKMKIKKGLEVVTRQDLQNLVTSVILRKKDLTTEDVLKEVLGYLSVPDNFVWLPSEERIKDCINNTIESLYNSGCLQLKDGKYAIRKNAFLD